MIIYLTHLTICWTILFLPYRFFLKKETFFRYNRWYLLFGLILGLIIPLIDWSAWFIHQPESLGQIYIAPIQYQVYQFDVYATSAPTTPWWQILLKWIYITGVIVSGFKLMKGIQEIRSLRHQATLIPKDGYTLVLTEKLHIPFSFINSIYWSRELYEDAGVDRRIMAHEKQHVTSLHSLDILFIEILAIIFWFHPLVYLYRKELKEVHEYEADAAACVLGSKKEYGQLLLHQAQSGLQLALANHFFYSQLKNRFKMMTRKPSTRAALLKYLVVFPVMATAALIFSFSIHEKDLPDPSSEIILADTIPPPPPPPPPPPLPKIGEILETGQEPITIQETDILFVDNKKIGQLSDELIEEYSQKGPWKFAIYSERAAKEKWGNQIDGPVYALTSYDATKETIASHNPEVFRIVEKMPLFPGCEDIDGSANEIKRCADQKMLEFLYTNLRYPESAAQEGIEGVVVTSFIVEKDGSLSNIKTIRSPDESLSKETLRLIRLMNEKEKKWIPGEQNGQKVKVEFLLPVQFRLNEDQQKSENTPDQEETETIIHGQNRGLSLITSGSENSKKPIIVIDGRVFDKMEGHKRLKDIDPQIIRSIHVLKNQQATAKYGESAKDGAIEIYIKEDPGSNAPESVKNQITIQRKEDKTASKNLKSSNPIIILGEKKDDPAEEKQKDPMEIFITKNPNSSPPQSAKNSIIIRRKDGTTSSENLKSSNPIIILDGELIGHGENEVVNTISPSSIESIHVLKGAAAIEKYGDEAGNGVIEIISKVPKNLLNKNDLVLTDLNVYPNPVQDQINIHFAGPKGEYRLEIMDVSGSSQKVKTLYHSDVTKTELDINDLNPGMYYLIITSGNKITTKPFVKQ